MEDRGQYMCQVNTDPMKMQVKLLSLVIKQYSIVMNLLLFWTPIWIDLQTAYLEVVIPPDIIYEETSGDMMVPEGSSAKLICKARGFPKPKITWRREDGRDIIARGGPQGKTKSKYLDFVSNF